MRTLKFTPALIAVFGLMMFSCTNKDVESRIARLEGRIAELENKSGTTRTPSSSKSATPTPAADVKPEGPLPAFAFNEELFDFGTITEGDVAEHIFEFTNTGQAPLIISSATGSCGCTVPEWPKEPIGIGEKGEIKVKFNSRKRAGVQNKTVTITANTYPKQKRIKIKANVLKIDEGATAAGPVKK